MKTLLPAFVLLAALTLQAEPKRHWRPIQSLAFSPDSSTLASAGDDGFIQLHATTDGSHLRTLEGHKNRVVALQFSPDGRTLFSAGFDGFVKKWLVGQSKMLASYSFDSPIRGFGLSSDGKQFTVGCNSGETTLHDSSTGFLTHRLDTLPHVVSQFAFCPTGKWIAAAYADKGVDILDARSLEKRDSLPGVRRTQIHFLDKNQLLVGGAHQRKLGLWSVNPPSLLHPLAEKENVAAFSLALDVLAIITNKGISLIDPVEGITHRSIPLNPQPKVLQLSPDGKYLAATGFTGGIQIWNLGDEAKEPLEIPPHDLSTEERKPAKLLPSSLFGKNLVAPENQKAWKARLDTQGAFTWYESGLKFSARSMVEHVTGHDALYIPVGIGTDPFDLSWEIKVDKNNGHPLFNPGLLVGLSSWIPGKMHDADLAFSISTQYAGLYPGILRGEPYYCQPNYINMANFSRTNLTRGGEVPVIPYNHHIKSFIGTDRVLHQQIRRDGLGKVTFRAWLPSLGQTAHNPWWIRSIDPAEHGDKPLEFLFIQRIPLLATHLGGYGIGYNNFETTGRLENLVFHKSPPAVQDIEWLGNVLKPGDTVTLKGVGLGGTPTIKVGGMAATETRAKDSATLTFTLPKLPSPARHSLEITTPDGSKEYLPEALPLGKLLFSIQPTTFHSQGGEFAEISGSGFEHDTQFLFNDKPATIIELKPSWAFVQLPKFPVGPIKVEATGCEGTVQAASRIRPSLYFDQAGLEQFRAKINKPSFAEYKKWIFPETDPKQRDHDIGQKPAMSGHFVNSAVYNLFWRYVSEPKEEYAQRLLEWAGFFSEVRIYDDIHFRQPAVTALIYDLLGGRMTPPQRDKVEGFLRESLGWYLKSDKEHEWFVANPSYVSPQTACYAIETALVLENQDPRVPKVLAAAKRRLLDFLSHAWHPDGGGAEGLSRNFTALGFYLRAGYLLERHKGDTSLNQHPHLKNVYRQLETLMAGPGHYFPFRSSHPELQDAYATALLARVTGNPFYLWATDDAARKGLHRANAVRALLFRPDVPTAPEPMIPTLSALHSVGWAALRSEPKPDSSLVVGIKGADGPIPWHNHRDGGSFVVYKNGIPLLVDPGWSPSEAEDHSVPIIGGVKPDKRGSLLLDTWEDKDWRLAIVDSSRNYAGIDQVRRYVLTFRDTHAFILDDISGDGADVVSRFQTPAKESETTLSGKGFDLSTMGISAKVSFSGPEVTLSQEKRRSSHPVAVSYQNQTSHPFLTAIQLGGKPARIERNSSKISIQTEGPPILFLYTKMGWVFSPPGEVAPFYLKLPKESRKIQCAQARQAPKIDGNLSETVWKSTRPAPDFIHLPGWRTNPIPAKYKTTVRYAYGQEHLYAAIQCEEPNPDGLVTTKVGPAQFVQDDDHLRLGFHNLPGGASTYATFNANGLGAWADIQVATARQKDSWTAEIAIPLSRLNNLPSPQPGDSIQVSVTRLRSQLPSEHSGLGLEREDLVFGD